MKSISLNQINQFYLSNQQNNSSNSKTKIKQKNEQNDENKIKNTLLCLAFKGSFIAKKPKTQPVQNEIQTAKLMTGNMISEETLQKRTKAFEEYFYNPHSGLHTEQEVEDTINHITEYFKDNYLYNTRKKLIKNFPWEELNYVLPSAYQYTQLIKIINNYMGCKDATIYSGLNELYKNNLLNQSTIDSSTVIKNWSENANNFPWSELTQTDIFEKISDNEIILNILLIRIKEGNIPANSIIQMAKLLSNKNFNSNIKKIVNNPNLEQQILDISNIQNMYAYNIANLLTSGITQEQFYNSIKQISKSLKLAVKTPNQYLSSIPVEYTQKINGKYPQLPDEIKTSYQRLMVQFFKDNFVELVRASSYLDLDTVNQMMDKRTNLFAKFLQEINSITPKNYELLSKLTKCTSLDRDGKALTANEKIQLVQIIKNYQQGKIDTGILSKMAESGSVSLNKAKKQIQHEILIKAGINKADLANIPEEKLKFNEEYAYLALLNEDTIFSNDNLTAPLQLLIYTIRNMKKEELDNFIRTQEKGISHASKKILATIPKDVICTMQKLIKMYRNIENYTDNEILSTMLQNVKIAAKGSLNKNELYTVIKEAVTGDFIDFILDTSNIYGQANAKTAQAFASKGINYEQWLKPDIEDVTFNLRGQEMTIKLWDRNPQEDLFVGNKTSCCTAIGTGGNGPATPIYLLNTSYNVVELYDASGNVVGMSRIFMADVDGKPSVIMDNIELNNNYKDTKASMEEKIQIRDAFFKYINKYAQKITGDSTTQVYFYSGDIHVPNDDLTNKKITLDFIGNLSQKTIYMNSYNFNWIDPTNLKNMGSINFLVVPKN